MIEANGGEVVFEEYYPLDQVDFSATVNRIISNKVDVVFNTVIPPGVGPFFKQLYEAGFLKNGGRAGLRLLRREHAQHQPGRTRSRASRAASTISRR